MNRLDHESIRLSAIHRVSNHRKHEAYWLGFLEGIIASDKLENFEIGPRRIEAEYFLSSIGDEDAAEILRDLDVAFENFNHEIYAAIVCILDYRLRAFGPRNERDVVNSFFGFCAGIACDSHIRLREVERLLVEIDSRPELLDDVRIASLRRVAVRSIADGEITPEESADIADWICRLVGDSSNDTGIATYGNMPVMDDLLRDHTKIEFSDRVFVATGVFSLGPRKFIESVIVQRGGKISRSVNSKTHYLVVGSQASRDWKHSHEGLKLVQARELRLSGKALHIVDEATFCKAMGSTF